MTNAPFADFQRGDIVGILVEGQGKLINKFLIKKKEGDKFFGKFLNSEYFVRVRAFEEDIELEQPYKYIKECSINLDE